MAFVLLLKDRPFVTTMSVSKNRRLVLTLYRHMVRWCDDVNRQVSLGEYMPASANNVDNSTELHHWLREQFRTNDSDSITEALQGIKKMNEIKPELDSKWKVEEQEEDDHDVAPDESWTVERINQVDWLPSIQELVENPSLMSTEKSDTEGNTFPLFPLTGSFYDPSQPLPLFSNIQDIPAPGREVPLKIFEPRYRKLYQDMLSSNSRQFVVPFSHPTQPGTFASHALLWEVTSIQEIADATNGKIQYVAQHLVSKPVKINKIINPQDWSTRETYLRVEGSILDDALDKPDAKLEDELLAWKDDPLAHRLREALGMDGVWGLVSVWTTHLQQELLQMQLSLAAQLKQTKLDKPTPETIAELQQELQRPVRDKLLRLMIDSALLVPRLLQSDTDETLCQLIHQERNKKTN